MTLLEEVWHWGQAFTFQKASAFPSVPSPSSTCSLTCVLSAVPASCLHAANMSSDPLKPYAQLNAFFYKLPWSWDFVTAIQR